MEKEYCGSKECENQITCVVSRYVEKTRLVDDDICNERHKGVTKLEDKVNWLIILLIIQLLAITGVFGKIVLAQVFK